MLNKVLNTSSVSLKLKKIYYIEIQVQSFYTIYFTEKRTTTEKKKRKEKIDKKI